MKTTLHSNEVKKDTLTCNGHKVDKAEWDADPDVGLLKSRIPKRAKAPSL